jgi:ribosome-associated translation inhibitor RaiA
MLHREISYGEVISPILSARLKRLVSELKERIPGVLRVNYTLKHVSRDTYEAIVSVNLNRHGSPLVVARKESKNVFTALNEATKAVLRQVFSRKEKLTHIRHRDRREEQDFSLPLAS